jgi:hypothetical protein
MRITRYRPSRFLAILGMACIVAPRLADAEPLTLPAGMNVSLILQHHVNSGYTPAGSKVYFRVAHDVIVGDQVLVAKDSLVTGQMAQATERGMVGRAGTMLVSVDNVTAVDGTRVPVDADLSKQGRSRSGATVGWTIFWGLPGLVTKGVNPYMLRGDVVQAIVTSATAIDPAAPIAAPAPVELGPEYPVKEHRWAGQHANGVKEIDIERKKNLETIAFKLALPPGMPELDKVLWSLRVAQVDGVSVPEDIKTFSVVDGAAFFDAWSIARYCNDGTTSLLLVGTDADGRPFHARRDLTVEIRKKEKKEEKKE